MGYGRKILAGMALTMIALLGALGFALHVLASMGAEQARLEAYADDLVLAQRLRAEKLAQDALVPAYVLSGDDRLVTFLGRADAAFDDLLAALRAKPRSAGEGVTLAEIDALHGRLRNLAAAGVVLKRRGASLEALDRHFHVAHPLAGDLRRELDGLVERVSDRYDGVRRHASRTARTLAHTLLAALGLAGLFCLAMGALTWRLVRRKRADDRLKARLARREREISQARKEAVETVAHDLRNPLSAVMMLAERLGRRLPAEGGEARAMLDGLSRSAGSMKRLIANLLDHAKIEAGTLELACLPCDPATLLEAVTEPFVLVAAEKGVALIHRAEGAPRAMLDEARMEQALSNLLGNALKFTPAGGTVTCLAREEEGELAISVTDGGPGLPAERGRLFERYWQSRDTAAGGTGLGLAICKAVVEAHGGRLEAADAPGGGAVFTIRLPLAAPG